MTKNAIFHLQKTSSPLFFFLIIIIILAFPPQAKKAYCSEPTLAGFVNNDLELRTLAKEVQKASLALKGTKLDEGVELKISTGSIQVFSSGDDYAVRMNPSASVTIPQARLLTLSAATKLNSASDVDTATDTKLALSLSIIGSEDARRKVSLLVSERALLVAKRNLATRALSCEKDYYTKLKELYTSYLDILKTQKSLYDDKIDEEALRAKGFSASSSKYRLAQMKVATGEHDILTKTRKLKADCAVFASLCSADFALEDNFEDFLPKTVQSVQLLSISDFEKDDYTKTELALYNKRLGALKRLAAKTFTLKVNGGYTFNNEVNSEDTIDAGLSGGVNGVELSAGVSVSPRDPTPLYTMGASLNPMQIAKRRITKQSEKCEEEEELIAVSASRQDFDTDFIQKTNARFNLLWEEQTAKERFEVYTDTERDMEKSFQAGVISESEYLQSKVNKEECRIQILSNAIDKIIFNDEVRMLFCPKEEELRKE